MEAIAVRRIGAAQHLDFLSRQADASFLQTPAWGEVKNEWRHESVGWFRGDQSDAMVGAGLVLYRRLPVVRRSLAYLPEGPVLDWAGPAVADQLAALVGYLRTQGAFGVRIGPLVAVRSWTADTLKRAIAEGAQRRLGGVPPDTTFDPGLAVRSTLESAGWRQQSTDAGFGVGQPQFVFQLPLAGRTADDVLAGMNQLWRRNIRKAAKAGVEVTRGSPADLAAFHQLYVETSARDRFTPRPLGYFQRMFSALLNEDADRIRLYLAHHDGDLVAATTWVRLGRHTWYSYGASSSAKRDVRGSNAIQWRMITDALDAGAAVYDLRGITDTLAGDDPHLGLIQFKLGTGGEAVELTGEWDRPISRPLYKAFDLYMSRR